MVAKRGKDGGRKIGGKLEGKKIWGRKIGERRRGLQKDLVGGFDRGPTNRTPLVGPKL